MLDPRALFERMFGTGQPMTPEERARQSVYRRSILDFVTEYTTSWKRRSGRLTGASWMSIYPPYGK